MQSGKWDILAQISSYMYSEKDMFPSPDGDKVTSVSFMLPYKLLHKIALLGIKQQ